MKLGILFFLLLTLNSCDLLRLLNTSKEKDESTKEINRFLTKHNYKYDFSFENIDSTSNLLKSLKHRLNNDTTSYSYIQLRIYDSLGNLYSGYSQCMGNFNTRKIIDSLPPSKNTNPFLNNTLKFQDELDLININLDTKLQVIQESKKYDYILVVYWTIWTNYFSKHVLKEVSNIKSKNPKNVLVIVVNVAKEKSLP